MGMLDFIYTLVTTLSQTQVTEGDHWCDDNLINDSSCVISETSTSIHCAGYRSCEGATILTTSASINCYGSYSCYKSTAIENMKPLWSSSGNIRCYGLFSCANVLHMSAYNTIYCYAEQSCFGSVIFTFELICTGDRSCANSQVFHNGSISLYGSLSGINSIFYSVGPVGSTFDYEIYGSYGAYNATIMCGSGHECDIECDGNSCQNLMVQCSDGSDNTCDISISCRYSQQTVVNGECGINYGYKTKSSWISQLNFDFGSRINLPSLIDISISTYENSVIPCDMSLTNALNCNGRDDLSQTACLLSRFDTTRIVAPICCTAYYGCNSQIQNTNITAVIPSSYNYNNSHSYSNYNSSLIHLVKDTAIRCDGYFSCVGYLNSITASNSDGPGNIYFAGTSNDPHGNADTVVVKTIIGYDIFCTGDDSCRYFDAKDASNVYCTGGYSCTDLFVYNIANNIYFYGYLSGESALMNNIEGSVYCSAWEACYDSDILNIVGNVVGNGYEVLRFSWIENVTGTVVGMGYNALDDVDVYNVTNVCVISKNIFYQLYKHTEKQYYVIL